MLGSPLVTFAGIKQSPFTAAAVPVVALVASLIRWYVQGSGNVYTALHKRFYVPDPDLGWRVSAQRPIWLGLEVCAIIAAIAVGLVVGGFVIRWRERKYGRAAILRAASWIAAVIPLAIPVAAFATGPGPADARDTLPASVAVLIESGIAGSIDAPAGRYVVENHPGTSITAHLSAGGEAFDARFAGDINGAWQGNPRDLTQPSRADVSVAAASVDTGIGERSKHAREGYLHADQFPRITVAIDRLIAAQADGPNTVAFRAAGIVHLIGKAHAVEIVGTLKKPDSAAVARLGLNGEILLAQADFSLVIRDTAFTADAGDFDGDRIPIHVSLVLRHHD
ncbi:MAG: YceI family protein [Myxococcales bacterium]|nr:YceI family protein [Myxococcales bacterium]